MSSKEFKIDSFSNAGLVKNLSKQIDSMAKDIDNLNKKNKKPINLMEVCGTHTMSIARYGLKNLMPDNIALISGPGCPVCVTSNKAIDQMIALTKLPDVIITTFGDMMRVPGSSTSLLKEQAQGRDIRIVYSPMDALEIANKNPDKNVIFLGVGFETTTPLSAATIKRAQAADINNFFLYCAHKNMPGALENIIKDKQVNIDALILPGHVSTITGVKPFEFIAEKYNIPGAITGFEPVDILQGILMLLKQTKIKLESAQKPEIKNTAKIEIAYSRGVNKQGNIVAQKLINEVFDTCSAEWRGLSTIEGSGYKLKEKYRQYDASVVFLPKVKTETTHINKACRCGDVLKGIISPKACPLFDKVCNPQNPIGPCMVSSEGSCSANYRYQK